MFFLFNETHNNEFSQHKFTIDYSGQLDLLLGREKLAISLFLELYFTEIQCHRYKVK